MDDNEVLVEALLSQVDVEPINDGFEEPSPNVDIPDVDADDEDFQEPPVSQKSKFNWNDLSDAEEEQEISESATSAVPSFAETISSNDDIVRIRQAFDKEYPFGRAFPDIETARKQIEEFANPLNTPFSTLRSDSVHIKLVCKHFGRFRFTREKVFFTYAKAEKKNDDEEKNNQDNNTVR
ncbi:MAG: hypothetical protein EXX96DRAFT_536376 [Benjaminiella poitrasii]|nr:MAG: hypothetical protein EXX96DRAFT_536376 [Benjaminiella poitrasii]